MARTSWSKSIWTATVTTKRSLESAGGWRELLPNAGLKTAALSGSGVFKDEATGKRVREIFFAGDIPQFQVMRCRLHQLVR